MLEIDGEPVIDLALTERRSRLERLLDKRVRAVQFSGSFEDGDALFQAAKEQGFEGIVAKKRQIDVPARPPLARLGQGEGDATARSS